MLNKKILISLALIPVLVACNRTGEAEPSTGEGVVLEQRVEELLEKSGVELPEGVDRADLNPVEGDGTGLATRNLVDQGREYTVLAALPTPVSGWYEAWISNDDGSEAVSLGRLQSVKGGYLVEVTLDGELSEKNRVVVTLGPTDEGATTNVVLEGAF